MAAPPQLSIVIPTRDRWEVLLGTLDAVRAQDLGGAGIELIVVDNGSSTAAPDLGEATVLYEPVPGAAAARNAGLLAARAAVILFLGDDCRPVRPDFVRGHLDAHAGGDPRLAVVGGIEWDGELELTPVMRWLADTGKMIDPTSDSLYTGNVSLRREALLWVAGFDERFRGYGWEDVDLGLRLADHGVRVERRRDLAVVHHHVYDERASLGRMQAMGRGANLLERLHDHRRPLPGPAKGRLRMAIGPLLPGRRGEHLGAYARGYRAEPPLSDDPDLRGYARFDAFGGSRPSVAVVVPFLGDPAAGKRLLAALSVLQTRAGDEIVVVDNTPGPAPVLRDAAVHANAQRSSYYARNAGADVATGEWLLFIDADCRPRPTLIDDYFAERIEDGVGAIAGRVMGEPGQNALVARYARSRGHLSQAAHMRDSYLPYGITANLLIRREAFDAVGGFQEGVRSGGDADICWRLQDAGWEIVYREPAAVWHEHRERLMSLARQTARYAAAEAWLGRVRPASQRRPLFGRRLAKALGAAAVWGAARRREQAVFSLLDAFVIGVEGVGRLFGNAAPQAEPSVAVPSPAGHAASASSAAGHAASASSAVGHAASASSAAGSSTTPAVLVADRFPDASADPLPVPPGVGVVEARGRPPRPDRSTTRGLVVRYEDDEGTARRAWSLARIALTDRTRIGAARAALRDPRGPIVPFSWLAGVAAVARRLRGAPLTAAPGAERRAHALAALGGGTFRDNAE